VVIRVHGHSDEPVVTFGFSVFGLIRFDDSDQADLDEATDVRRSVHENHDIERVSVLAKRGRNEAEIEREHHPLGKETA